MNANRTIMAVEVNYEAIELAYSLVVFNSRADYTRTIAYEEDVDDEPFTKALEYWGGRGESVFRAFLLIHEGVMILQGDQLDHNDNQQERDFGLDATKNDLPNGKSVAHEEIELKSILRNSYSSTDEPQVSRNSHRKQPNERKTKRHHQRQTCSISTTSKQRNRSKYTGNDNVNAPLCDPESDLTGTEEENDVLRPRPRQLHIPEKTHCSLTDNDSSSHCKPHKTVNIHFHDQLDSSVELTDAEYPLALVSKARWERAKAKFQEVESLLAKYSDSARGSQVKLLDFYRLHIVSTILNCVDNLSSGIDECIRLVTRLNSLTSVQGTLTRALETPRGWKQRLTQRLHDRKWDKMLSLVHFISYMTRKWLMLGNLQDRLEHIDDIPCIDTSLGPVHPTQDWCVRDKCQTCVEFVGNIPHACAIATNSKDQLVMIDSRNYITVYTIEGKALLAFKASTSRHPHARWIMGIDDEDNMYLGSALATVSDSKQPLSIFTSTGTLLSEPDVGRIYSGRYHLYAVSKSAVILTLTVATNIGNMVTLQHRDGKLITAFPVREIALPRVFNATNDNIIIGGATESKDFAFQIFDHYGQQLYFYKPEVSFQYCQVDPWTGSLVLVTTSTLRDYRYCLCNTVVLTGQVCILATNGQTIQSGINLRWPFRRVAGVTLFKCGLVAVVTIDEPYYAIHVI